MKRTLRGLSSGKAPRLIVGPVPERHAAAVKAATGANIAGATRVVDGDAVMHALRSHGDAGKEARWGRAALTRRDIERLPQILEADPVIKGGHRVGIKPASLTYTAKVGRWTYTYVEVIRPSAGQVAFKNLWKR